MEAMEYKLFLDTNALLNLGKNAFEEEFVIAQKTLEEIEHIKSSSSKDGDVKYKARQISNLLNDYYGKYEVVRESKEIYDILEQYYLSVTPDNIILASACYYESLGNRIIVCTDDLNCKFISRNIFGFKTKSVNDINLVRNLDEYKGFKDITLSDEEMSYFYCHLNENLYDSLINEYLIIRKSDGEVVDHLKWTGEEYKNIFKKNIQSLYFDKLKPKDAFQACAIDSLMSNTITAITGKAGSGKSLLTLMTAMYLIEKEKYDRIVILFNPTKTRGASDMGFYSGDVLEKAMQNSIGQILTTKFGDRYAIDMLLSQNRIKLVSMADCRGMEISDHEILWITEAQNTSVDLIKLCLSRVSSGAKVFIEGDYLSQVDSYAFDGNNNGLRRMIQVFKDHPEFGYVQLQHVWRSKIAELCELL